MNIYTIFNKKTGEIEGSMGGNVTTSSHGYIEGEYCNTDYYIDISFPENPKAVQKGYIMPEILPGTTINVGETVSINGIPPGVTLTVEGESHVVEDGIFEIDFTEAEDYPITMTGVPYLDWTGTITVKAAS